MLNTAELEVNEEQNIDRDFCAAVKRGLSGKQKFISSKFLYDDRGSELFIDITRLDEYYLTRCEAEIFGEQASDIVEALNDKPGKVVELGCGDGVKTEKLLSALTQRLSSLEFEPVDISEHATTLIRKRINRALPDIDVKPWLGDYDSFLQHPATSTNDHPQLVLFLGSNIGNFSAQKAREFMCSVNRYCQPGDYFLLGLDLKKDIELLHAAYNDKQGVTRAFNFNLLTRMNRELGANFKLDKFTHHGFYNVQQGAMQSYLVSREPQIVEITALGMEVEFDTLEAIHIEDSHKYSLRDIDRLAVDSGFKVCRRFMDSKKYFVDVLLQKPG